MSTSPSVTAGFLSALDRNGDGKITRDEALKALDGLDSGRNVNGKADRVEWSTFAAMASNLRIDKNVTDSVLALAQGKLKTPLIAPLQARPSVAPAFFDFSTMTESSTSCGCGPHRASFSDAAGNRMIVKEDKNNMTVQFARAGAEPGPVVVVSPAMLGFFTKHVVAMELRETRSPSFDPEEYSKELTAALVASPQAATSSKPAWVDLSTSSGSSGGSFSKEVAYHSIGVGGGQAIVRVREGSKHVDVAYLQGDEFFPDYDKLTYRPIAREEVNAFAAGIRAADVVGRVWTKYFGGMEFIAIAANNFEQAGNKK